MKNNKTIWFKLLSVIFFIAFLSLLFKLIESEKQVTTMEEKIDYLEFKVLNLEEDVEEYQEEIDILNYSVDTILYE